MLKLTQHMKQVLKHQPVVLVATRDDQGRPNISPKSILKVVDDDKLVFADLFSFKTRANLQADPRLAVAAVDLQTYEGYQFKGQAELVNEGPLFKEISELLARGKGGPQPMELWFERASRELMAAQSKAGRNGEQPGHIVVLHIEEIWNLTPGHEGEVWRTPLASIAEQLYPLQQNTNTYSTT
ncbi:MAG: pyridoxamine 5'-phosphate oxidase family protein [Anaerolineae bacterium]